MDRIVILATHVVSDVEFIAKEILMLENGHLLSQLRPSQLLQQMKGNVFEIPVTQSQLKTIQQQYSVSNIRKDEWEQIWVRVVTDQLPSGSQAQEVSPTLEDVYLYTFESCTLEEEAL